MSIVDILVCPDCRSTLSVDSSRDELVCGTCQLAYPVRDGVPVMIVDKARKLETS
ncbi:MAG: hypothetical protein JWP10_314 [Nocardioidaceae bacterium]|nr:hypothetical protein [Nocardioidaceae bacterium]